MAYLLISPQDLAPGQGVQLDEVEEGVDLQENPDSSRNPQQGQPGSRTVSSPDNASDHMLQLASCLHMDGTDHVVPPLLCLLRWRVCSQLFSSDTTLLLTSSVPAFTDFFLNGSCC